MSEEEEKQTKILIPISKNVDKEKITQALTVLYFFREPLIVLLHVIEVPITAPLNIELYQDEKTKIEKLISGIRQWLEEQGFKVKTKIAVARNASQGIIEEANSGGYSILILMKRRPPRGLRKLFYKSHTDMVTSNVNCISLIIPIS
ncbi:MAG: universal stress protein [Candidatus Odinarchaeia archaeon]